MLSTAKPFLKHRREEDRVCPIPPRAFHFMRLWHETLTIGGGKFAEAYTRGPQPGSALRRSGQMNPVGSRRNCDIGRAS